MSFFKVDPFQLKRNSLVNMPKEKLWTRDFILLCAAAFMTYLAFYSQLPVLVLFLGDKHGITDMQAGVAMSVYTVSAIVSRLYSGYLLDTYGRRIVYLLPLFFFSGIFLLYISVSGMAAILILRLAHGLAWGLISTAAQTAVADIVPPVRRGEGIGLFGVFFSIAMAVGPLVGTKVVEHFDYTDLFILESVSSFIGLGCAFFAAYLPAPAQRRKFRIRNLVETSSLPVGGVIFFFLIGYGSIMNWISVHAQDVAEASAGWFFTCTAIGTGLVRLFAGKIYDRRGPVGIISVGFVLYSGALFMLALLPHYVSFYAAGVLLGAGMGIVTPVCVAIVNSLVGSERRGAANSTYFTLLESGIGLGVLLTGALMPAIGLRGVFAVCGFVAVAAAALFFALAWPWSRRFKARR